MKNSFIALSVVSVLFLFQSCTLPMNPFTYPKTEKRKTIETFHGHDIIDFYAWLEDDRAKEVESWVEKQNEVTFTHLESIPFRGKVLQRMKEIYNYPKYTAPFRRNELTFFYKNDGLQNQSVLYIQKQGGEPEVLLDPNTFSAEGTTRLASVSVSADGAFMAYSISRGGSDWQDVAVMDLSTRKVLIDTLSWVKVSGLAWAGKGFYYSRYPTPEKTDKQYSVKNEHHQVFYHRLGDSQEKDQLVYEDPENPLRFHIVYTTKDERFAFLSISDRNKGFDGNALYVKNAGAVNEPFKPIIREFEYDFDVIDHLDGLLLVRTNKGADNGKVVLIDPEHPSEDAWKVILPEREEPLAFCSYVGGKLIAGYMKDVTHRVYVFDKDGTFEHEVQLPGLGTVGGFTGDKEDKRVYYTFTSFTFPPSIYEYRIEDNTSTLFRASEVSFNPDEYETKQVFVKSKDGVNVPLFIVHKKGVVLDGKNPTLLYGYGGFNISLNPTFDPLRMVWLEQGGVYAVANLRGGSEYGEKWHQAGMLLKKQTVFDDFIACARWLIGAKYTSPKHLGIQGRSNGGLLVGAAMTQDPSLFAVALPGVGVMDMLRYERFTIGWNWAAEYGSVNNAQHFKNLWGYSPYHNLKSFDYPATLVVTADHDDRVVPAHSFKFIARLQEKHIGTRPVMIRIGVNSGHGASSTEKLLQERADEYTFLMYHTSMTPSY